MPPRRPTRRHYEDYTKTGAGRSSSTFHHSRNSYRENTRYSEVRPTSHQYFRYPDEADEHKYPKRTLITEVEKITNETKDETEIEKPQTKPSKNGSYRDVAFPKSNIGFCHPVIAQNGHSMHLIFSLEAYKKPDQRQAQIGEWSLVNDWYFNDSVFCIYTFGKFAVIACRGTQATSPADILNDIFMVGFNRCPPRARTLSKMHANLLRKFKHISEVQVTGHSLGGITAACFANASNILAVTFNGAAHPGSAMTYGENITSYHILHDLISSWQPCIRIDMGYRPDYEKAMLIEDVKDKIQDVLRVMQGLLTAATFLTTLAIANPEPFSKILGAVSLVAVQAAIATAKEVLRVLESVTIVATSAVGIACLMYPIGASHGIMNFFRTGGPVVSAQAEDDVWADWYTLMPNIQSMINELPQGAVTSILNTVVGILKTFDIVKDELPVIPGATRRPETDRITFRMQLLKKSVPSVELGYPEAETEQMYQSYLGNTEISGLLMY